MASRPKSAHQPDLSPPPATAGIRGLISKPLDARGAIDHALTSLAYNEAVRAGCLGDTGCGKSRLMRAFVKRYLEVSTGIVIVVVQNAKKAATWGGQVRSWPADLHRQPLLREPRIVVFTGDTIGDEKPLVAAAQLAWTFSTAARSVPCLVVFDELANAVHPRAPGTWKSAECSILDRLFTEGRDAGVSVLWATQFPQVVPLSVLNETEDVFAFRLAGSALTNLRTKGFTDGKRGRVEPVLNILPDTKTPPPQRGAHLLLQRGHGWDGRVYRVLS